MTRRFTDTQSVPITVVKAEPNTVVQLKNNNADGYTAVQVGASVAKEKNLNKPLLGHLKSAKINHRIIQEYKTNEPSVSVGDKLEVTQFEPGDKVTISGRTKGKGYAGVIKRHGFHRGPETHGSDHHRAPGAIGGGYPQRVVKGKKMPGHLGNVKTNAKKVEIIDIIPGENLILLKGSIPGANKSWITIQTS